jgi:5-hydroxyisourate hydrolase
VISTHVLDTSAGRPAAGVPVALERAGGDVVARAVTDADGRVASFGTVAAGTYRLVFDTAGHSEFFPRVSVDFVVGEERLHVPLLLNPFGYSTYRGS